MATARTRHDILRMLDIDPPTAPDSAAPHALRPHAIAAIVAALPVSSTPQPALPPDYGVGINGVLDDPDGDTSPPPCWHHGHWRPCGEPRCPWLRMVLRASLMRARRAAGC